MAGGVSETNVSGAFPYSPWPAHGITLGPDGQLRFTEFRGDKIGRITTSGVFTEFPINGSAEAYGIASGPDGNL